MKAAVLLIVAALTIGVIGAPAEEPTRSPSLPWYYDSPCQQPTGTTLHNWLSGLEQYELVPHGWDCSQTSAYVEWLAENCGYNAVMTCRLPKDRPGHCWVTIEGEHFEATGLYWVSDKDPLVLEANVVFEDIYEAWAYTSYNKLGEWGWWATYPRLREVR